MKLRLKKVLALDLYTLAASAWLAASPLMFATGATGRMDDWVVAAAIAAISVAAFVWFAEWEEWLKLALGVWLIVAPWALGFTVASQTHVSVGVGIFITFITLIELWLVHYPEEMDTAERPIA